MHRLRPPRTLRRTNAYTYHRPYRCFSSSSEKSSLVSTAINEYINKNDSKFNVPETIISKLDRKLHLQQHHPLNIIKKRIEEYCSDYAKYNNWSSGSRDDVQLQIFDNLHPFVTTHQCFDQLRVPPDHVSRQSSDTYYLDSNTVLRTHTSAHQCELIKQGACAFLVTGEVYRRDEIDATHYPVFHQMEGVRIFSDEELSHCTERSEKSQLIEKELKEVLSGLATHLFGDVPQRWRDDYFPFTEPSFELEVFFNNDWLEVLGCGVIHEEVMNNAERPMKMGWAFGLGLERLAMVLFKIPDIRLFWSTDERFIDQFHEDNPITAFIPYSKYPACYKDVSFWLPETTVNIDDFHPNDVYEVIREVAGDMVEKVELFDTFQHKKTKRFSHAYRVHYRHMDRNLTNEEVDAVQMKVREKLQDKLYVTLR